jgi:hypothetical protein
MAATNPVNANVTVKFVVNEKGNSPGKLADAELHFNDGVLAGLKLVGFAVWERRSGGGRNVSFPARQYSVNGQRRSFALLRPIDDRRGASSYPRSDHRGIRRSRGKRSLACEHTVTGRPLGAPSLPYSHRSRSPVTIFALGLSLRTVMPTPRSVTVL